MLYVIDASLTGADEETSGRFLAAATPLLDLAGTCPIRDEQAIFGKDPGSGDGVVLFNSTDERCPQSVERFLKDAQDGGAVVMPVAVDASVRRPPYPVSDSQSFDVVDELRRRDLSESRLEVVARAFGRAAVSRVQPTCSKDRLRLFLCHRRADGEDTTARLDRALSARHPEHVFRDLVDVVVSQQAQEEIEKHLATADVIVFLDTPRTGESPWVGRELELALGAHVPIVWVRIGEETDRVPLAVRPAAEPHLTRVEVPDQAAAEELADAVLDTAFDLHRAQFRAATAAFHDLRTWADEHGATVRTLDQRLMIYEIRYPAPTRNYPTRAPVDVLQLFGRHPTDEDQRTLSEWLDERSLGPHGEQCRSFDAAIMLDPYPIAEGSVSDWSVVESSRRYLETVTGSGEDTDQSDSRGDRPGLLLLGAFPNGTGAQQALIDAVHAVTTTWVSMGGTVVLGGHPTFTPLVIHAARLADPDASTDRVVIYQSLHFVTNNTVIELADHSRAVGVEAGVDRPTSLTAMRTQMVGHEGIRAVVAIGGRTSEGGTHVPGIDEEIDLARANDLPVFLIGAAGGRAAELADAAASEQTPWASLGNHLDSYENELLAVNDNYEALVRLVWEATT